MIYWRIQNSSKLHSDFFFCHFLERASVYLNRGSRHVDARATNQMLIVWTPMGLELHFFRKELFWVMLKVRREEEKKRKRKRKRREEKRLVQACNDILGVADIWQVCLLQVNGKGKESEERRWKWDRKLLDKRRQKITHKKITQKKLFQEGKSSKFWWMNCPGLRSWHCWTCLGWECTQELSTVSAPIVLC